MKFDYSKRELVYYTTDWNDSEFQRISIICKTNNWRFVLIITTIKKYPYEINEIFKLLGDDFLIYEISMGMGVVLKSRANKYVEYIKKSELYEKNKIYIS